MQLRRPHKVLPVYAFCLALLAVLALGGCAKTEAVRLFYNPSGPVVLPAPGAPTLAVVMLEDRRPSPGSIGARRDDSPIHAEGPVNSWISQGLADELSRMGPQVSYAINIQAANAAAPDYIVTGTIEQVWVKEVAATTFQATIQLGISISDRHGPMWGQTFSSTQEKTGLPRFNQVETLLNDTLHEVLAVAAPKINEAIR